MSSCSAVPPWEVRFTNPAAPPQLICLPLRHVRLRGALAHVPVRAPPVQCCPFNEHRSAALLSHPRFYTQLEAGRFLVMAASWAPCKVISPAALSLIEVLLRTDPRARPTIEQVEAHPWFAAQAAAAAAAAAALAASAAAAPAMAALAAAAPAVDPATGFSGAHHAGPAPLAERESDSVMHTVTGGASV